MKEIKNYLIETELNQEIKSTNKYLPIKIIIKTYLKIKRKTKKK